MVRLTAYMKKMAARGNARVVQPTLPVQPILRDDSDVDHVRRTRSNAELRRLPYILCLPCFGVLESDLPPRAFERCRDAGCGDTATGCEMCGGVVRTTVAPPLSRDQSWRRYGR